MKRTLKHTILDKAFGRELKRFLYRPEIFSLLESDGTWLAGGCWILADALRRWIGPRAHLKLISSSNSPCEHVVVQVNHLFIHASGVMTEGELLDEMRIEERLTNPRIDGFNSTLLRKNEVPVPGERSVRLALELGASFQKPSLPSSTMRQKKKSRSPR